MAEFAIRPHPDAPLFTSYEEGQTVIQQLITEVTGNMQTGAEVRRYLAQAGLVNLWFFLKFILGYNGPYDELNDGIHLEMCNWRQSDAAMGEGARAACFVPRAFCKCECKGTVVPTKEGPKKVEELAVGDVLYGVDGHDVVETAVRGVGLSRKQSFAVTLRSGRTLRVGSGHKFLLPTGWTEVDEIEAGTLIARLDHVPFSTRVFSPEDWVMGLIYGDGAVTGGSIVITIGNEDADLVDLLKSYYERECIETGPFGHRLRGGMKFYLKRGGEIKLSIEKSIPPSYEGSAGFLSGLFDADGSVNKGGYISYCTASEKLAEDIQRNLLYFGIISQLTTVSTLSAHGKAFHITITDSDSIIRFRRSIGFKGARKRQRLWKLRVRINKLYRVIPYEKLRFLKGVVTTRKWKKTCPRLDNTYSITRDKALRIAALLPSEHRTRLLAEVQTPIVWDKIVKIENIGNQEIVPISVEGKHNYVNQYGVLSHNSTIISHGGNTWETVRDPNIRIRLESGVANKAHEFLGNIKNSYETNELLHWLYPFTVIPAGYERTGKWAGDRIVVPGRTRHFTEATVTIGSMTGASEGGHFNVYNCDDPVGLDDLDSMRNSSIDMFRKKNRFITNKTALLVKPRRDRVLLVGTRYAVDDIYDVAWKDAYELQGDMVDEFRITESGEWSIYNRLGVTPEGEFPNPEVVNKEVLDKAMQEDMWFAMTQLVNHPQKTGLAEFYEMAPHFATIQWDAYENDWIITYEVDANYDEEPDPDDLRVALRDCDVVMSVDPAGTDRDISAKTSRSSVGVWARDAKDRVTRIWGKVGYLKTRQLFDAMFEGHRLYAGYVRATYVESNAMQKILKPLIEEEQWRKRQWINPQGLPASGDKAARIRNAVGYHLAKGTLYLVRSYSAEFLEEHAIFPMNKYKMDVLDEAEKGITATRTPPGAEAIAEEMYREDEMAEVGSDNAFGY